ncbi:MAG TPA: nicotinate-nicotinamide nucleotide adenylyltransferase [Candidatus Saccharimonadales bacterium]|nr:nicotinate-nicotinamide nucleotide adenylyltransferase [Candidatus Saccharimonadales bacterium]
MKQRRIGIYPGVFDPVHTGHVTAALQAMEKAGLDELYFLPERRPRAKQGIEHFGHRVAMLRRAATPHPRMDVLELEDVSFTVEHTLRRLRRRFPRAQLVFLFGSDVVPKITTWPRYERLLNSCELAVSLRDNDKKTALAEEMRKWPIKPLRTIMFNSHVPTASSKLVRLALRQGKQAKGLLKSVERYSRLNWLYISVAERAINSRISSSD